MNGGALHVRQGDPSALAFGISPLHAWIRSMECLLHIAYRVDVKKWAGGVTKTRKKRNFEKRSVSAAKCQGKRQEIRMMATRQGGSSEKLARAHESQGLTNP
ncbi:hypothetical protein ANCCEY_07564 [Ancylostoma ceylanicum]|uniref:Uncharacterized protein n=1 Tax=Ancylostoma ceylanicum TaxID=53326 RepID=A0A0D6M0E5_9BILA|nr:hypothetical protein ANCCEY_07564 [Ancylostoma ceylanicum]